MTERPLLRLLTAEEVAALFQVSKASVYRWAEAGTLPAVRIGRSVRFNREAVEELVRTGATGNGGEPRS